MSLVLIVFSYLMIGCCVFRVLRRVLEAGFPVRQLLHRL